MTAAASFEYMKNEGERLLLEDGAGVLAQRQVEGERERQQDRREHWNRAGIGNC